MDGSFCCSFILQKTRGRVNHRKWNLSHAKPAWNAGRGADGACRPPLLTPYAGRYSMEMTAPLSRMKLRDTPPAV